jgi:hypothetical protein
MVNNLEEENSDDLLDTHEDSKSKSHVYRKLDLKRDSRPEVKQIYVKNGTFEETKTYPNDTKKFSSFIEEEPK